MKILTPELSMEHFFRKVADSRSRALLLDYDGTLAPFKVDRDAAVPYPGVGEVLNEILKAGQSRIILITGRSAHDLLRLLSLDCVPEIWGSHGMERLTPDAAYRIAPIEKAAHEGLAEAKRWIAAEGLSEYLEEKPASLALHTRGLDPALAEQVTARTRKAWSRCCDSAALLIHEFDGGLELRVRGIDKGSAVETILGELGPDSSTVYMGDDWTDEDALRAIKGKGLGVLVRTEFRPTLADLWLRPPEELVDFLKRWHEACRP